MDVIGEVLEITNSFTSNFDTIKGLSLQLRKVWVDMMQGPKENKSS